VVAIRLPQLRCLAWRALTVLATAKKVSRQQRKRLEAG
jgi:hypothetical protein